MSSVPLNCTEVVSNLRMPSSGMAYAVIHSRPARRMRVEPLSMSQLVNLSSRLPAGQSGRFLIAEDDAFVREVLVRVLTAEGNSVQAVGDGRQALGLYENDKFDLVILDYEMPDMSGDELALIIKALAPTQPLIMIDRKSVV